MWTLILLNIHQLADSKKQINIHNLKSGSTDIARSYKRRRGGDGMALVDRLLQTAKFRTF